NSWRRGRIEDVVDIQHRVSARGPDSEAFRDPHVRLVEALIEDGPLGDAVADTKGDQRVRDGGRAGAGRWTRRETAAEERRNLGIAEHQVRGLSNPGQVFERSAQ